MARGMASVTLVGNLGKDPELRYLESGNPVANFSIAVNRKTRDAEYTDWYRVAVFGKQAETADKFLRKGSLVAVAGQQSIRTYTASDGNERTSVEVNCDSFTMLGSKTDDAPPPAEKPTPEPAGDVPYPEQVPF